MEGRTDVETLFMALDDSAELLKETLNMTYLEALVEAGENLFQGTVQQEVDESVKSELLKRIESVDVQAIAPEGIRKSFQLAILKGMKEGTQAHHAITPDAVAVFMSYLVNKLKANDKAFSLLDPAVGTGNLLAAILNQSKSTISSYGFEVDETLLNLAFVSSNLQEKEIQFFHEDSIKPIKLPTFDVVVSDLPVGYYPNDEIANGYTLKAEEGKSFTHHLLIERAIEQTKEGGYLLFLVPNFLFESEQAAQLQAYVKTKTNILGLLQLPSSMFKSQEFGKSIFLLQKKGEGVTQPRQALLAELPSFSKQEALTDMIRQIDKWFKEEFEL
ncbi:class I SAM-dependent methyltransferase [Bacillus sp. FJAT-45350]|uniref:class I SAM-dependent methyltransferase n=1 Tax=Bacillus sp. FJAT-45350 TaxID=2011014 RepID=UPI000BB98B39|nr:class I SAM-dependent methyltransferase [Bacillus sp. FJAT-45350]